jgi:predicted dehydrogenase
MNQLRIALVGMRFGGVFPEIYRHHPDVAEIVICDTDEALLNDFGDKHGYARRFTRLEDVLAEDDIDAVHLVTPIHTHGKLSLDVLNARKHCACTVPMGTTLEELAALVEAERRTGRNYMMMETAVYTYHCLHAQELIRQGEIGRIQFLRGAHYQDMENWPDYWMGLPPMHYATHAIAPLLALSGARATRVHCFGSGIMRPELQLPYGNPFPIETAIFQLEQEKTKENLAAEVTRSLFHTARSYAELFSVYGEKATFEWQMEHEMPVLFRMGELTHESGQSRGRTISEERTIPSDFSHLLPESIQRFSKHVVVPDPNNPHQSVLQGGGHHGSHPHLVHEFVRSIIENRPAAINATTAANWSAAGICAHESALHGGIAVELPVYSLDVTT